MITKRFAVTAQVVGLMLWGILMASNIGIELQDLVAMLNVSHKTKKRVWIFLSVIMLLVGAKCCWVKCATRGQGSFEGEKKSDIRDRHQ